MKAIISHDIDHFTLSEHYLNDLIVPKFFIRSKIEFLTGKISLTELLLRVSDIFTNKWQNINELIDFNNSYQVPSTFFIAVEKGTGLSYNNKQAKQWIEQILKRGCQVGIHGIEFDSLDKIKLEREAFSKLSGLTSFGSRMHYIRADENTYNRMAQAGLFFDTSEYAFKNPYKIGNMWQFPFQIMDGYIMQKPKQWQCKNLEQCKEQTKKIIEECGNKQLSYIGVDFHDRYFNNRFVTWKDWYTWLIDYLNSQKIEFVNFNTAIAELEKTGK